MGDINQSYFLEKYLPKKAFNNILDIGSKDYGNTQNFRSIIEHKNYVGIDMEAGKNVDHVIDLTKTIEPLQENFFDLKPTQFLNESKLLFVVLYNSEIATNPNYNWILNCDEHRLLNGPEWICSLYRKSLTNL